jgi:hypothetical protein
MIEPLSIEAAKDKAAQELRFNNYAEFEQSEFYEPKYFPQVTDRAMILFSESQLQCKMEEIEQALPGFDDSGREGCTYGDTDYDSISVVYGRNEYREQIITILKNEQR